MENKPVKHRYPGDKGDESFLIYHQNKSYDSECD